MRIGPVWTGLGHCWQRRKVIEDGKQTLMDQSRSVKENGTTQIDNECRNYSIWAPLGTCIRDTKTKVSSPGDKEFISGRLQQAQIPDNSLCLLYHQKKWRCSLFFLSKPIRVKSSSCTTVLIECCLVIEIFAKITLNQWAVHHAKILLPNYQCLFMVTYCARLLQLALHSTEYCWWQP